MRPLAFIILAILGVLYFCVHRLTGSFWCFFGTLFLLFSIWSLICAACPQFRGPNVKCLTGVSARDCIVWAVSAAIIGATLFAIGLKFQI
jgi:hypothetical protein